MPKGIYDRNIPAPKRSRAKQSLINSYRKPNLLVSPDSEESPNNQELGDDQDCRLI